MTEQVVAPGRGSFGTVVAWVLAGLGALVAVTVYFSMLMGLAFSVALSETPPSGVKDWIEVLLLFSAFAGLPPLAAFVMLRRMRSRLQGGMFVAAVAWTVPLTSLLCFGIYFLVWNLTVGS